MRNLVALVLGVLFLAGCAGSPAVSPGTGIRGVVLVGPTCPVERLSSPCPPNPIAATVDVRDANDHEVARVHSGSDGRFQVQLAAGTYSLLGQPLNGNGLPRPVPVAAVVTAGRYTAVTVEYDSGIR